MDHFVREPQKAPVKDHMVKFYMRVASDKYGRGIEALFSCELNEPHRLNVHRE